MIPKIIHYCWLGGNPKPDSVKKCIESWSEKFPDYEICCWDESIFDINSVPYVREAMEAKKWAYAADYIRLEALYNYGGIYLDTDVEAIQKIDDWLQYDFIAGIEMRDASEFQLYVSPAVLGSKPHSFIIKTILSSYEGRNFKREDGTLNMTPLSSLITPQLRGLGWERKDKMQVFQDVNAAVFPTDLISNPYNGKKDSTRLFHQCHRSWVPPTGKQKIQRFFNKLRNR